MARQLELLGKVLDKQSYEWLLDTDQDVAAALAAEVKQGATPDDIRRFVLAHIGPDRHGLAQRCQSAARHLAASNAS